MARETSFTEETQLDPHERVVDLSRKISPIIRNVGPIQNDLLGGPEGSILAIALEVAASQSTIFPVPLIPEMLLPVIELKRSSIDPDLIIADTKWDQSLSITPSDNGSISPLQSVAYRHSVRDHDWGIVTPEDGASTPRSDVTWESLSAHYENDIDRHSNLSIDIRDEGSERCRYTLPRSPTFPDFAALQSRSTTFPGYTSTRETPLTANQDPYRDVIHNEVAPPPPVRLDEIERQPHVPRSATTQARSREVNDWKDEGYFSDDAPKRAATAPVAPPPANTQPPPPPPTSSQKPDAIAKPETAIQRFRRQRAGLGRPKFESGTWLNHISDSSSSDNSEDGEGDDDEVTVSRERRIAENGRPLARIRERRQGKPVVYGWWTANIGR